MSDGIIPEDIKQFILQNIHSITQLEGLLIFRANPQKEWNAETIARELFISESQTASLLVQLAEQSFITACNLPQHYRYQPKSPEWGNMVERIAELHKRCLLPITNLIHSKPKIRVQKFADAFKIRKE